MAEEKYMKRAIALAEQGAGWTAPNPLVGAVIVKDGKIIGEGYHRRCGELHAERNALASCKEDPAGSTLYVTLEPCCHYGRTPPCTEAILENHIARVVIGSRDPNPLVAGKGAKILREQGVRVEEDFLREECDKLNPIFFHYITTGKPYVAAKYAMTADGKIATKNGASKWITGEAARHEVHRIRGRYAAILAGIGTVLADDPLLTARLEGAHQPLRILCDTHLRIPMDSQIVKTAKDFPTIIACTDRTEKADLLESAGIEIWALPALADGILDLQALTEKLGKREIDSVLIEGGGQILGSAFMQGIVNHVYAFMAPKVFGGKGAPSPVEGLGVETPDKAAMLTRTDIRPLGPDLLIEYDVQEGMNSVHGNC